MISQLITKTVTGDKLSRVAGGGSHELMALIDLEHKLPMQQTMTA